MVTRKDIADRLGVSVSVVSRALNNSGYVDREKKQQILDLARDLGYSREPVAIREEHAKNHLLVFYLRDTRNPFYIELYDGMLSAADERGYGILLFNSKDFDQIPRISADGIIFSNESLAVDYLKSAGKQYYLPAVSCSYGYNYLLPRAIPQIDCDILSATQTLIEYLRKRGHTRIAMVSPEDISSFGIRVISWQSAMVSVLGNRLSEYIFIVAEDQDSDSGAQAAASRFCDYYGRGRTGAKRFVESGCDATAVICFNEEMALGFCRKLMELKVRIPEDLSVVTYDATYQSRFFQIPVTKINLNPRIQGRMCAETLIDLINGKHPERVQHVPIELIEGVSVGTVGQS